MTKHTMSHNEWQRLVRVELLKRDKSVKDMARDLGYTAEWCRATLYGRDITPGMVAKISEYTGVKNYMEG